MNGEYIGTEHLLLAAAREATSVFESFLGRYNINYDHLCAALRMVIAPHPGSKTVQHRSAAEAVDRALNYAFRDRRAKKRDFRRLWIARINAGADMNDISYSKLMGGLKKAGVELDRKVLSNMAILDAESFSRLVRLAKEANA